MRHIACCIAKLINKSCETGTSGGHVRLMGMLLTLQTPTLRGYYQTYCAIFGGLVFQERSFVIFFAQPRSSAPHKSRLFEQRRKRPTVTPLLIAIGAQRISHGGFLFDFFSFICYGSVVFLRSTGGQSMRRICSSLPLAAASVLVGICIFFSHSSAGATEWHVPADYATIQAAITAASSTTGDSVLVSAGIYQEAITLKNNVPIHGSETARTFLSGGGSGPVVTADGAITSSIYNFTFVNASSGIQVSNNANISITNNVFQVGTGGTAITIQNSSFTRVINNTFYQNGTALSSNTDIQNANNIYANNTTAISDPSNIATLIDNNAFSGNGVTGPTGTNSVVGDPLFVDPVNQDFHLQEGSPCIDAGITSLTDFDGTTSDIGAYGGPSADPTPVKVAGLSITSTTNTSIGVSWSPNNCYLVTNTNTPGGYKLYYGYASGDYSGTDASSGTEPSPIDVGPYTNYTLMDLSPPTTSLSAPVLDQPSPRDGQLALTWSEVSGATGYQVHYGVTSTGEQTIDVGNTTFYMLSGLTNGQNYHAAVSAYAQPMYFIAVTAYDSTPDSHESAFSAEVSSQNGPTVESGLSNVQIDFPEALILYPALPDSGKNCFIATAAYGYYAAPEVQALRAFRDRYLMTSAPGRMFVAWYYRHGPAAAEFLNAHPGYKPVVRAALMPAVGAALFMTQTSVVFKGGMFLLLGVAIAFYLVRKRPSRSGGIS